MGTAIISTSTAATTMSAAAAFGITERFGVDEALHFLPNGDRTGQEVFFFLGDAGRFDPDKSIVATWPLFSS